MTEELSKELNSYSAYPLDQESANNIASAIAERLMLVLPGFIGDMSIHFHVEKKESEIIDVDDMVFLSAVFS